MTNHSVAELDEVVPGELKRVVAGGVAICLARLADGRIFAIADTCTHEQTELSDGLLDGDEVECPAHGSRFNVATGAVRGMPAREPVACFPVRVESQAVVVEV